MHQPPVAFYFRVEIQGPKIPGCAPNAEDAAFEEVSGLEVSWDVEEVAEGGENRFVHRLPKPAKHSNLVLKRGSATKGSYFVRWVQDSLGSTLMKRIVTQNMLVSLLDATGAPTVTWNIVNAYPVKCSMGPLNSMDNKILLETIEFSYNYFERSILTEPSGGGVSK